MPGRHARAELHYTEWSTSYTPSDPIHDSYHSAAFILDKLKGVGDAAQSMSYWTFTDIFEEAGPRATPFHGGLACSTIRTSASPPSSPTSFSPPRGHRLLTSDPDAWVCRDDKGGVQALFWDFTVTHPGPSMINQEYYRKDLPAKEVAPVRLASRAFTGKYGLRAYKVGYRSNDAYTAYLDMGSPGQLSRTRSRSSAGRPAGTLRGTDNLRRHARHL